MIAVGGDGANGQDGCTSYEVQLKQEPVPRESYVRGGQVSVSV